MDTRFWGPDGWLILHTTMYNLPKKMTEIEKKKLTKFIKLTSKILPCKYCRISMSKYIKSLPIEKHVTSKEKAIKWIYKLHNKVNNKLRKQGYCITTNPTQNQVNDTYKDIHRSLEQSGSFILENMDRETEQTHKGKTKKRVRLGFKNFDNFNKKVTYTKQELILCNNFIGSIIFNFPNIYTNSFKGNLTDLLVLYKDYFSLLLHFMSRIDSDIVGMINEYIKANPLDNIFKDIGTEDSRLPLETVMKFYEWYFTLCKKINNSLDTNEIDIAKFTNKFKKYIVRTCTTYKTINEKTKKLNTCRIKFGK